MNWRAKWAGWILVATLAGYPIIAAASVLAQVPNRPLSIVFRAALVLSCALVLTACVHGRPTARSPWFQVAWGSFWFLYLSRMVLDFAFNPEVVQLPWMEYATFAIGVCLLPAMAARHVDAQALSQQVRDGLLWFIGVGLALNLWVIVAEVGVAENVALAQLRVETETLNPISLGHLGVSGLLVAIWCLATDRSATITRRLALLSLVALAAFAVVTSASRGPMLSLALGLLALSASRPTLLVSPAVLSILGLGAAWALFNPEIFDALLVLERLADGAAFSDDAREGFIRDGWNRFIQHPFLGAGLEPLETYPHNLVLESFMATGLLGGILFIGLLAHGAVSSVEVMRRRPQLAWLSALYVQYVAAAMVTSSIYGSSALWCLLAVVGSLSWVRVNSTGGAAGQITPE